MRTLFSFLVLSLFLFISCQQNRPRDLSAEETAEYLEQGQSIVKESFKALSGQLASAMNQGGVQNAVSYCNIQANPIMDSLSQAHGVTVSRVSLRPRNPGSISSAEEAEILKDYLRLQSEGKELHPFVETYSGGKVTFYAPITIISPLCLKCHGTVGGDIAQQDYELIRSLYPEDEATGYTLGELRGMWIVKFDEI